MDLQSGIGAMKLVRVRLFDRVHFERCLIGHWLMEIEMYSRGSALLLWMLICQQFSSPHPGAGVAEMPQSCTHEKD